MELFLLGVIDDTVFCGISDDPEEDPDDSEDDRSSNLRLEPDDAVW